MNKTHITIPIGTTLRDAEKAIIEATLTVSTVYTLPMPKYVYVQIQGVEAPAKIAADKVEKRMSDSTLVVKER